MNARKMFEKLKYKCTSYKDNLTYNKRVNITYKKREKQGDKCIDFELMPNGKYGVLCPKTLYIEEIKAIYQQLKELNVED